MSVILIARSAKIETSSVTLKNAKVQSLAIGAFSIRFDLTDPTLDIRA